MTRNIAMFWHQKRLNFFDRLCLQSFVDCGYSVSLFTYRGDLDLPDGVTRRDAAEIVPLDDKVLSGPLPNYVIDFFRVRTMAEGLGTWVDRGVYCAAPLEDSQNGFFAWENNGLVSPALLDLPHDSDALEHLQRLVHDPFAVPTHMGDDIRCQLEALRDQGAPVHVANQPWGVWGAHALTHALAQSGEIHHARPRETLAPISFADRGRFLSSTERMGTLLNGRSVLNLHVRGLEADMRRDGHSTPAEESILGQLLARHGVDADAFPLSEDDLRTHGKGVRAAPIPLPVTKLPVRPLDKVVAVTTVTNEGPFLLDWIAYHMSIGTTHFLIYTSPSDDGTENLLDALAEQGCVTRRNNRARDGEKPIRVALKDAWSEPVVQEADAVIALDVDEYINVHAGRGHLADLFSAAGDPDLISVTWRNFGTNGHIAFDDGPVPERFIRAAPRNCPTPPHAWGFKTILRREALAGGLGAHRPHHLPRPMPHWTNGTGEQMPDKYLEAGWRSGQDSVGYGLATVNHYAVRSCESFALAQDDSSDDAVDLWNTYNRNDEQDVSILPRYREAQALCAEFKNDPVLGPLHGRAVERHKARAKQLWDEVQEGSLINHISADPLSHAVAPMEKSSGEIAPLIVPAALEGFPMRQDRPAIREEAEAHFRNLTRRTEAKHPLLAPLDDPPRSERIVVVSSMKNEGCFILEWIAYHLSIGVTHFLIYTNDCDDPTNEILDQLQTLGIVTRRDNPFNRDAGQKPQRGALNDAAMQPQVVLADWVGVIDVDEFVNIHVGDGTFRALLEAARHPNVISMTWRLFGNRDVPGFEDLWQTEQFTKCAPQYLPKPRLGWGFKSFFRPDGPFEKLGVHRPLHLDEGRLDEVRWVNGSGRAMPERVPLKNEWFSRKDTIGYSMVTLNHYVLRAAESFLVKRQRGRINHVDQDQGIAYWTARNYATEDDTSIHAHLPRAKSALQRLLKDVRLQRLHQDAVDWHRARIKALMAEPDYRELFKAITNPDMPDAIWRAPTDKSENALAAE